MNEINSKICHFKKIWFMFLSVISNLMNFSTHPPYGVLEFQNCILYIFETAVPNIFLRKEFILSEYLLSGMRNRWARGKRQNQS